MAAFSLGRSGTVVATDLSIQLTAAGVEYKGTAEQLTDEGLLPAGFAWPRDWAPLCWDANGRTYRIQRAKLPEQKSRKLVDHWQLLVWRTPRAETPFEHLQRACAQAARELLAKRRQDDCAGAWRAAVRDETFQAFKAKLLAGTPEGDLHA